MLESAQSVLLSRYIADAALEAIPGAAAIVWSADDSVVVLRTNRTAATEEAAAGEEAMLDGFRKALAGLSSPWRLTRVETPPIPGDVHLAVRAGARVPLDPILEEWRTRHRLTERKARVLAHLVRGETNKEIAVALDCAENTVELHVTWLLKAAGTSSRAALIARFWSGEV